jgi:hypothetical protein
VVTWRISPERTPCVLRACARCGEPRRFGSSDRFRVNASGRKLDVWLIYRCERCDFTWNLTVVERSTPEAIGPERLRAFHENDRDTAWRCAFDEALLGRAGARIDGDVPVRVERAPLPVGTIAIRFEVALGVKVRLDRLLAAELAVPRARVSELLVDADPRALRRPVVNDQRVHLSIQ